MNNNNKTNRWALNVFYFMIDFSVQNAFSLSKLTNETQTDVARLRQNRIEILGLELTIENA